VMRYVSKIDHQWVRDTLDRAKLFDQGQVWLNGESKMRATSPAETSEDRKRDSEAMGHGGHASTSGETEQAKKRARLEMVEAARKRAVERRQNK